MGWAGKTIKGVDYNSDYKLEDESFEVYVPESYTGERPFGLVVFVSPGGDGGSITSTATSGGRPGSTSTN